MRAIVLFLLFGAVVVAQPQAEVGELNGAQFRIDIPENWNRVLIMYCHGYSPTPGQFKAGPPAGPVRPILSEGYAIAQSGYAAGGWAVEEALQDTEALRRYFIRKYGAPSETYVTGHSMGGFLTMTLVEKYPDAYDGGLPLCGPLAPASWFMERQVFDIRVVGDYYFPGLLPSPAKVPDTFKQGPEIEGAVLKALEADPQKAEALRKFAGIRTNLELARVLVFWTYILQDLERRCGGNPFDNRNTIYEGTDNDDAVNDKVARYTADPGAEEYVRLYYTPTGHLTRPLLAIHNTYDPLVPPWVTNMYSQLTENSGSAPLFVQQYVKRPGHCAFTASEVVAGLKQLREWKQNGQRPPAGATREQGAGK